MGNNRSAFNWIENKLGVDKNVLSISIEEQIMHITRKNGSLVKVSTIDLANITELDIKEYVKHSDFILHLNNEAYIDGSVYSYLETHKKVIGDFGDLFRLVGQDKNYPYHSPEVGYILRGLKQHSKVSEVKRLDRKRYKILKKNGETVVIISLNDYDVAIEAVRTAIDIFKSFNIILCSNPNARISSEVYRLVSDLDIKVLRWGELFRELNLRKDETR